MALAAVPFSVRDRRRGIAGNPRTEIRHWSLASANSVWKFEARKSRAPNYSIKGWYPVLEIPATVLEILQEDGVYPNLYYGENLAKLPPLYQQDWWYRVSFKAPAGGKIYWLDFPGINYRAEIWLNGKRIADNKQVVGMYAATQLNVTDSILPGQVNTLAGSRSRLRRAILATSMAWSWRTAGSTG